MPDKENKDKRKWYILDGRSISLLLVLLIAILFYVALTHFDVIQTRLSLFMGVVSPFIAGFAIAYLLNTPMCFFERKVYRKLRFKRGLSILTVYLLALALVVILLQMILPQVVQSIMDLATNMQYYLNGLERLVQQVTEQFQLEGAGIEESLEFIKNLTSKLTETVASSLPQLLDFGMAVGSGIISGITAVISSIYMLAGKGRLVPQLKKNALCCRSKAEGRQISADLQPRQQGVRGFHQRQADRLRHYRRIVLPPVPDPAYPVPHADQRCDRGDQHHSLFWPHPGCDPLPDDPGHCGSLGGAAFPGPGHRPAAVRREHPGTEDSGRQHGPVRHLGPGGHRGRRRTVRVPGYGAGRAYVRGALRSGAGVGEPPPGRQGDRWKRDAPHKAGRTNRRRIERCSPGRAGGTFFRQALETRRIFVYTKKRESLFCGGLCAVTNIQLFRAIGRVDDALLGRSERTVGNRRIQMRWAPPQT